MKFRLTNCDKRPARYFPENHPGTPDRPDRDGRLQRQPLKEVVVGSAVNFLLSKAGLRPVDLPVNPSLIDGNQCKENAGKLPPCSHRKPMNRWRISTHPSTGAFQPRLSHGAERDFS